MEAGQSTRQHSDLALLYPRSKSLQTYIIEFFTVVVQICLRYHRYAQKSALEKFTSSLNDSDIREARSSLLAWSKSIQAEITTLIARRIETEAGSNSRFRAMMDLSSRSIAQQQRQIIIRDTLDRCSKYDYETTWRQIRKAGNTSLFTQIPEYVHWTTGSDATTLILVGKLGCGKSVTLANMVDDLNLRIDSTSSGLAYFFCRHDLPESLVARTVIGALTRQIISLFPQRLAEMEAMDTHDFRRLLSFMYFVVPRNHVIYIILDGLDLCSPPERMTVTEQLELMETKFNIRICVSRPLEPEAELHTFSTEFSKAKAVRFPDNTSDIDAFVKTQLETALSNQSLALGDPAIILEIQNALLQGSEHMFLWVVLQIRSLCAMQTDHDIREALADLPRDLSQIYSRILQKSSRPNQPLRSDIFKLILSARRPLSADEMREALSVTPGNTTWNHAKRLNSIYPALATCGCLVTVDEEEHTIRTVHPSVDQFLLHDNFKRPGMAEEIQFRIEDAQTLISSIIVTYLSYGIFGTELAVRVPPLDVGSATSHIIGSTMSTGKSVQLMALKLLKSRKQPSVEAFDVVTQSLKQLMPRNIDDFVFQHYAKAHVLEHLAELPILPFAVSQSLFRMVKHEIVCISTEIEAIGLLWLLLQTGRQDILDLSDLQPKIILLSRVTAYEDNIKKRTIWWSSRLFCWAIETSRAHAVEFLLNIYRPIIWMHHRSDERREDVLIPALIEFYLQQAWPDFIIKRPTHIDVSELLFGAAPLRHAIKNHQYTITKILLADELIDINEGVPGLNVSRKPIGLALKHKDIQTLELLLSSEHRQRLRVTPAEADELLREVQHLENPSNEIIQGLDHVMGLPEYAV